MIRFYKSYLGRMFLGLLLLIELEKQHGKSAVVDAATRWQAPDSNTSLILHGLIDSYANSEPETDDVLKGAVGQLTKKRTDDADLLDTIVNILKLPFTSFLSGKTLLLLRDAVLTPSELTDLKKAYKAVAACSCGHTFTQNEMATVTVANDALTLKCTKCQRPAVGRCDYCGEVTQLIGNNSRNALKEVDCGCRKKAERAAKIPSILVDTNPVAARALVEQARQLRAGLRQQTAFYGRASFKPTNIPLDDDPFVPAPIAPAAPDDDLDPPSMTGTSW